METMVKFDPNTGCYETVVVEENALQEPPTVLKCSKDDQKKTRGKT